MEHSKLISGMIAKFKIAYPYYFKDLKNEELIGMISMFQEELSGYNELTISNATKSIIRNNKFMPTLKEIIDECEKAKTYKTNAVIEKMIKAGYFKDPREIDKTYKFIEEGIIPDWLVEDMKKYGYEEEKSLEYNNFKLLGDS
ncbi:MAG: replicative helicase loader/inhibitor [Mycoplasmatota bacterium]|nr:replicative helicase loader/inhibitor [Mycoplasmatota bacterium]